MAVNHKFNAFLFDLDGTLLDTAPEFAYCMNKLLKKYQLPSVSESLFRNTISNGANGMIRHAFDFDETHPDLAARTAEFLSLYTQTLGQYTRLFPGIETLLKYFQEKKIHWGIVTNKTMVYTKPLVAQFPLLQSAGCIVAGDTLPTRKPDSAPVLYGLEQIKSPPHKTLFIGDAETDVLAGKAAGLKCAVVEYGYIHPEDNAHHWNADYYISHAEQLIPYCAEHQS